MSIEDQVREASMQFYAALTQMANGDAGALAEIWSHDAHITTMHPIGGREVGWKEVEPTWGQVAELASGGSVELEDRLICVVGDLAYESGNERGQFTFAGTNVSIDQRATNIYRKEAGGWKIIHHHTDISPAMVDVLSKL